MHATHTNSVSVDTATCSPEHLCDLVPFYPEVLVGTYGMGLEVHRYDILITDMLATNIFDSDADI